MKKLAAIAGIVFMITISMVSGMAYASDSPTTTPKKLTEEPGQKETERKSPKTGEAPILLSLGAAAVFSAAGIVVCLSGKKSGKKTLCESTVCESICYEEKVQSR